MLLIRSKTNMMDMLAALLILNYSLVFTSFIFIIARDLRDMNEICTCCVVIINTEILQGTFLARVKTAETGKS